MLSIDELIKRDTITDAQRMFQIQGIKDDSSADVVYINRYKFIPIVTIKHDNILWVDCSLYSYMTSECDLMTEGSHKMIGYLMNYQTQYCGSLNYVFVPDAKPDLTNITKMNIKGHFEIQYEFIDKNNNTETKIIVEIPKYSGMEESIYILTTVLVEKNILEYAKDKVRIKKTKISKKRKDKKG
jgi:hypothetical protein